MNAFMKTKLSKSLAAATLVVALGVMSGCKNKDEAAVEQAESQAATTNTSQQVQWVDSNGNTVTKIVQPPAAKGQRATVAATSTVQPAAGQPKPAATDPVITPLANGQMPMTAANTAASGQSATDANGQPYTGPGAPAPNNQAGPVSVTVPAGTELAIRINESISVKHTPAGAHFSGEVAAPVMRDNTVLIPKGTPVHGRVDASHRRGHFKGSSILELRLTSMTLNGNEYALDTHDNVHTKKGKGKRTAGWIGGMTGAGALIGGIASGGVGLAIGAASGAGAGTLIAGATGNRDIDIPAESIQHFRLADDLVVQAP